MSKINNYQELVAERIRLEGELELQKVILKKEMNGIRTQLEPFANFVSFLGIFKKTEKGFPPILKTAVGLGIDLIGGKTLSSSNWLARGILPTILRSVANRFFQKKTVD